MKMEGKHSVFPGYAFIHTPTLIEGGEGESLVPGSAKTLIDARLLPNQDNREYIKKVGELARRFRTKDLQFTVKVKTNIPAAFISPQEKIVRVLKKLAREVLRKTPNVQGVGPASEGYMFIQAGIPTVCGFGVKGDNAHAPNEYVNIDSFSKVLEIYVKAALRLSGEF